MEPTNHESEDAEGCPWRQPSMTKTTVLTPVKHEPMSRSHIQHVRPSNAVLLDYANSRCKSCTHSQLSQDTFGWASQLVRKFHVLALVSPEHGELCIRGRWLQWWVVSRFCTVVLAASPPTPHFKLKGETQHPPAPHESHS